MATARQLPADVYPETLSRLPPLKRETLNEAQQKAYDALAAPRSGRLNLAGIKGPGGVILRMPKLAKSLGEINHMLRSELGLDARLVELSILATAREMQSQFEWAMHEPAALAMGVPAATIDMIRHGRPLADVPEREAALIHLAREAVGKKQVTPATYATALALFGEEAGPSQIGMAQSVGRFSPTGNLTRPRQFHTATLLTNGKVLIAGGFSNMTGWSVWASAELYDPATGTFTATSDMTTARYFQTATMLPNGKVLITGGNNSVAGGCFCDPLAGAELYDSSTGTFTAIGSMTTARSAHSATLLNDGKVLIAGGSTNRNSASAELYDPSTETFAATGALNAARWGHKATMLINGKVLIEGGYDEGAPDDRLSAELYDADTGTFNVSGRSANSNLFPTTSTLLMNGMVLFTLAPCCDFSELAEVYDPTSGIFRSAGKMNKPRGYSTSTLLPDGKVLIAGRSSPNSSAELYDPVTDVFSTSPDLITNREEGYTATLLPDGSVLLSGGWRCCGYTIDTAEIYHPAVSAPTIGVR